MGITAAARAEGRTDQDVGGREPFFEVPDPEAGGGELRHNKVSEERKTAVNRRMRVEAVVADFRAWRITVLLDLSHRLSTQSWAHALRLVQLLFGQAAEFMS